jgi:hypothetical protein
VNKTDQGPARAKGGRPRKTIDPEIIKCLGTAKDQDIASQFGRTLKWVRKTRQKLSIPAYSGDQLIPVLEQNDELVELLGKVSDRSLAARFGGSNHVYRMMREARGILPWNHDRATAEASLWETNREAAMALLGKVADTELARRFGGFQCRYGYLRNRAGIPPFDPKA